MRVQCLTETSIFSKRGTEHSIGYDICSDVNYLVLKPGQSHFIQTGLAVAALPGYYLCVAPRSTLTLWLVLLTPIIEVMSELLFIILGLLIKLSNDPIKLLNLLLNVLTLQLSLNAIASILPEEELQDLVVLKSPAPLKITLKELPIPHSQHQQHIGIVPTPYAAAAAAVIFANASKDINLSLSSPFDIDLTSTPLDSFTDRTIPISGTDDLLGFDLEDCPKFGYPKVVNCKKSTPSARIPRSCSELRNNYIHSVNGIPIKSISDIRTQIAKTRSADEPEIKIGFALLEPIAIHTETGLPQFFYDQMNVIGKHLFELNHDPSYNEHFSSMIGLDNLDHPALNDTDQLILEDLRDIIAHKVNSTDLTKQ